MTLQGGPATRWQELDVCDGPHGAGHGVTRASVNGFLRTSWTSLAAGFHPSDLFRRARGTPSAPEAVESNDLLLSVSAAGHDGSAFSGTQGNFSVRAAENWTPTARGTMAQVFITALGGATLTEAFRVNGVTTAEAVRIQVFDVTGASLKQVSRGAADSGGVGFRLLRIPN